MEYSSYNHPNLTNLPTLFSGGVGVITQLWIFSQAFQYIYTCPPNQDIKKSAWPFKNWRKSVTFMQI